MLWVISIVRPELGRVLLGGNDKPLLFDNHAIAALIGDILQRHAIGTEGARVLEWIAQPPARD